jgi:hypothetical protein
MVDRIFSVTQKLKVIERAIEDLRWARNDFSVPENRIYLILKGIADDLRARLPETPGDTLRGLDEVILAAKRAKLKDGYETGHLRRIAEYVIGSWPVLRRGLEKLQEEQR